MAAISEKGINTFKTIWDRCEPFYGGTSTVPDYQMSLYYTQSDGNVHRRIQFPNPGTDDLAALYAACKPAQFGRNRETVRDDAYRKAKKMDLDSFSTLFDPHSLGILEQVSRGLLTGKNGPGITEMELYKLNVYGEGDFFKPHKDTPRSENMVGSLVVVLPTQHEGGQLMLRQHTQMWTLDFADKFTSASDPLVCFVAFFGDVEHEVFPVTSGYRVTLTYNLYREPSHPNATVYIPTPFHGRLKKALVEFINDKSTLPEGGYLGCGLVHEYVYNEHRPIDALLPHLKGADQILAMICEELGLRHLLTLLYRDLEVFVDGVNLISRSKLSSGWESGSGDGDLGFWQGALHGLTIANVEGVEIIGYPSDHDSVFDGYHMNEDLEFLRPFYRNPVTKILEIRPMSSVTAETPHITYGNEASLEYIYGEVSMLIALDPVASRKELVL